MIHVYYRANPYCKEIKCRKQKKIESDIVSVEEVVKGVRVLKDTRFTKESSAAANDVNIQRRTERRVTSKIIELDAVDEYRKRQDQIARLGLGRVTKELNREELPEVGLAIIMDHGLRVLGGEWEMKSAEEATKVAKIWHDILRLEMGEPTSISSNQPIEDADQRKNRFEELKVEAKRRIEGGLRAVAGDGGS